MTARNIKSINQDLASLTEIGDAARARRVAKDNPIFHGTKAWMAEKILPFLDEVGMINPVARWIYRRAHLVA